MNLFLVVVSILPVLLFTTDSNPLKDKSGGKNVEFCEIAQHPEKYEGTKITFIADYTSVFTQGDLLSDSRCNNLIYVSTADNSGSSEIRDQIYAGLKDIDGGVTSVGRFRFVGFWRKNLSEGSLPIKDLVQGYTMIIESAEIQKASSK